MAGAAQSALAHEPASPRASEVPAPTAEYLPYLGFSLTEGWLDPWVHSHYSREGTPFVHLFNLEPAYLDRDFFFVYRYTREPHAIEEELEVELEWAFTRRIGLMVEAELEREREAGETETELGDFKIAPRFLLVEAPASCSRPTSSSQSRWATAMSTPSARRSRPGLILATG
ncbi:hypothetical protein [Halomonas sp. E19]|uniref:hypothetical protein n=1 Tax=Halomonas sp. E19 TaxID=3397247 RepID=UPI004034890E